MLKPPTSILLSPFRWVIVGAPILRKWGSPWHCCDSSCLERSIWDWRECPKKAFTTLSSFSVSRCLVTASAQPLQYVIYCYMISCIYYMYHMWDVVFISPADPLTPETSQQDGAGNCRDRGSLWHLRPGHCSSAGRQHAGTQTGTLQSGNIGKDQLISVGSFEISSILF